MLLKLLSPMSVLAGLVTAALAIAILWPVDEYGTAVAVTAFAASAGLFELFRRLRARDNPPSSTRPEGN